MTPFRVTHDTFYSDWGVTHDTFSCHLKRLACDNPVTCLAASDRMLNRLDDTSGFKVCHDSFARSHA